MISLKHVNMSYDGGVQALSDVNLEIEKGEFVFIVGESGSGKSTLMKLLTKELDATSGEIIIGDRTITRLKHRQVPGFRRELGIVFQDFRLLPDRNVFDNVAFAQKVIEVPQRLIKKQVQAVLSMVGLAAKYKSFPDQLAGGEQQRVAIARALINKPKILLADEPTGNLDYKNSWEIMDLLEQANDRGTTVIVVTHNLEIVNKMKKRTIVMRKGVVVKDIEQGGYIDEI